MHRTPQPGKHRLEYLDSIRAVAAIGVAYIHSDALLTPTAHGWDLAVLNFFTFTLDPGKIGVVAFFMVSGFIIPSSFKSNVPRSVGLRNFLISRIFRLYPAYWLSILAISAAQFARGMMNFSFRQVAFNLTMFQGFAGVENLIGVYWTLQIEWIFYLACVTLFLLGWLDNPKRIFFTYLFSLGAALALATVRSFTHKALPVAVPLGICVMFMATLWRMAQIDKRSAAVRCFQISLGTFLAVIPVISILAYNFATHYNENWYRYTLCYWAAVCAFLLLTTKAKITFAPLSAIGRASYSLYLFADIFGMIFEHFLPPARLPFGSAHIYIALKIAFDCGCAILVYHGIEKPCVGWGKSAISSLNIRQRAQDQTRIVDTANVAL